MSAEAEKKYDKHLRQMRIWNERQSWSKDSLIKYVNLMLDEVCPEKSEPAGTKYDEAAKELRSLKDIEHLSDCFKKLHEVIDKHIPDAKKELV